MELTNSENFNRNKSNNSIGLWDLTEKMITLEKEHDFPPTSSSIELGNSSEDEINRSKKIDFVLAYMDDGNFIHAQKREVFQAALRDQGLELYHEQNGALCFVKVHAPQVIRKKFLNFHFKILLINKLIAGNFMQIL